MTVRWTKAAMAHLVAIHEHIARDSPRYASRMVDRITAHVCCRRSLERLGVSSQAMLRTRDDIGADGGLGGKAAMTVTEDTVEQATIEWFEDFGYAIAGSMDSSPWKRLSAAGCGRRRPGKPSAFPAVA